MAAPGTAQHMKGKKDKKKRPPMPLHKGGNKKLSK